MPNNHRLEDMLFRINEIPAKTPLHGELLLVFNYTIPEKSNNYKIQSWKIQLPNGHGDLISEHPIKWFSNKKREMKFYFAEKYGMSRGPEGHISITDEYYDKHILGHWYERPNQAYPSPNGEWIIVPQNGSHELYDKKGNLVKHFRFDFSARPFLEDSIFWNSDSNGFYSLLQSKQSLRKRIVYLDVNSDKGNVTPEAWTCLDAVAVKDNLLINIEEQHKITLLSHNKIRNTWSGADFTLPIHKKTVKNSTHLPSPDGEKILIKTSCKSNDNYRNEFKIYDINSREELYSVEPGVSPIYYWSEYQTKCVWSPDSRKLAVYEPYQKELFFIDVADKSVEKRELPYNMRIRKGEYPQRFQWREE